VGTQDKSFERLLKRVEEQIIKGNIKDKVIVQAGYTPYKSKYMEIFEFLPMDTFNKLLKECDILITHGGVGSIITGLKNGKTVIAAARLKEYGEHTNDHQLQIIKNFSSAGYILELSKMDELNAVLKKAKKFKPKKYESNTSNMVNRVGDYIDNTKQDFSLFNFLLIIFVIILFLINIL
ncbi:MAG: PssE/Cps14G family polysaccharide biosynthesis glycosyltransferase, partial [Bacilli bacterium]